MSSTDQVNRPAHYTAGGIECIDAIEASMSAEEFHGFLKGNIIKYMWRYKQKGGTQDLNKANFYLNHLVKTLSPQPPVSVKPDNLIATQISPHPVSERLSSCRAYLIQNGFSYPKSGCDVCGSIFTSTCKYPEYKHGL